VDNETLLAETSRRLDDRDQHRPLTLGSFINRELVRRGRRSLATAKMSNGFRLRSLAEARWAMKLDDNPEVCAAFAVESVLYDTARTLRFDVAPPGAWVRGEGRPAYYDALQAKWTLPGTRSSQQRDEDELEEIEDDEGSQEPIREPLPFSFTDIKAIRGIALDLPAALASSSLKPSWSPRHENTTMLADVGRPPVEALVLAALASRERAPGFQTLALDQEVPSALCIATGWGGAAQAMSALLRMHRVFHLPEPYHDFEVPPVDFDLVVLNIPSRLHWVVAEALRDPGALPLLEMRSRLRRGRDQVGGGHVTRLVQQASTAMNDDTLLVVMADEKTHQQAMERLQGGNLRKVEALGFDKDQQPIWVGYDRKPWAPHNLPRPTGRCVTFWSRTP